MIKIITTIVSSFRKENSPIINWTLLLIIIIGFLLRVGGIAAGLQGDIKAFPNPDESAIIYDAFKMIQTGNFNPHPLWVYPTLYIYLQAIVQFVVYAVSVGTKISIPEFVYATSPHYLFYLFGRFLTVIFGTASIFILYKLSAKLFNKKIALIASALLAVTFVHVWASQFVTSDIPMTFFGLISMYFSAKILQKEDSWRNYLLAGLFIGLALATRYNSFIFFIPLITSYLLTHFKKEKLFPYFSLKGFFDGKLIIALIIPFLVFILIDPYTILDLPHFLSEYTGVIRGYQKGIWLNLSIYGNMPAWLWYIKYAATSGLYWPLFFTVLGGIIFGSWPITKAKILILSYLVANFFLITSMGTIMDRHLIQMSPYLNIFAAIFIVKLGEKLYGKKAWPLNAKIVPALQGLFIIFLIFLFGLGILRSFTYDRAIMDKDTRVQAAYWFMDNVSKDKLVIGVGTDIIINYLRKERYTQVYPVYTLGPAYEKISASSRGEYYVIITSVDYNWPRQYYKSPLKNTWSFDGLSAKEIYDRYEKLKKDAVLVKEISNPLFKNGFYGPGYLEMSSTITTWRNPTVEIYKVPGVK